MILLKFYYLVPFVFFILCVASCRCSDCTLQNGEIIAINTSRVVDCETLYLCDEENELQAYPACPKLKKCGKQCAVVREQDKSKDWPECCPFIRC